MQTTTKSTNPLAIRRGRIARPQKVVIYGPEGVGKSTLASQTPDPVFLDTEGGTHHLDVARLDAATTWEEITAAVAQLAKADHPFKTLVIDTADWLEKRLAEHLCRKSNKDIHRGFRLRQRLGHPHRRVRPVPHLARRAAGPRHARRVPGPLDGEEVRGSGPGGQLRPLRAEAQQAGRAAAQGMGRRGALRATTSPRSPRRTTARCAASAARSVCCSPPTRRPMTRRTATACRTSFRSPSRRWPRCSARRRRCPRRRLRRRTGSRHRR